MNAPQDTNYIIEFHHVGKSVKVTAIDPVSMLEVSIVGSPKASRDAMAQLAVKKLEYVMAKKAQE